MASKPTSRHKLVTHIKHTKHRSATLSGSFDVLVLATMSAGKTSLINALIGQELLHSANEATTSCVTSVEHRQGTKDFSGACYSYANLQLARQRAPSVKQIREWNDNPQVEYIRLYGKFRGATHPTPGLVLHDTPGPNNSQDGRHARLMLEALQSISFKVLCFVLNAGQLGTQDDRALLEMLREQLVQRPRHQLIFILNKVDLLDPEHEEDIVSCVNNAKAYLKALGFDHPVIIPTMANLALYARKALNAESLTRVQSSKLRQALNDLKDYKQAPLHAVVVPESTRRYLHKNLRQMEKIWRKQTKRGKLSRETLELQQLVACSGVWTVETLIKHQHRMIVSP